MIRGTSAAPLTPLTDEVVLGSTRVVPFEVPGLGNRTYIAVSDNSAILVDPPRDVDSLLGFIRDSGWSVTHVFDTHIHNDYISGGLAAARLSGADYIVPSDGGIECPAHEVTDGEVITVGAGQIRAVRTPGHTPHHMSYVLSVSGRDIATFTGGGLLYSGVGRTDLFGADHAEELAHAQWRSARRLAHTVEHSSAILPTHGFGSFCSVGDAVVGEHTLVGLHTTNPVFLMEEDSFVHQLLENQGPYPDYFNRMGELNRAGTPADPPAMPPIRTLALAAEDAAAGKWVLDLRHRHAFADGHLAGSLSFDAAGAYVTYIGWLIPWDADLHLVVPDEATLQTAVIELGRIAINRVRSAALWRDGSINQSELASMRHADGRRLRAAIANDPELRVLDVRLESESERARLAGQRAIPIHQLTQRLEEVREWADGHEVWVYCGSGFRSAVGASLLNRAGIPAVHVDGSVVES
ncbi:MAG: MBL fold metallo-hydrolase [Actinomycetes bacterium]